jgi:hypothetical protein
MFRQPSQGSDSLTSGEAATRTTRSGAGSLEPLQNQKARENYVVPLDGIQILPAVNSNDDTLRVLFGRIRATN